MFACKQSLDCHYLTDIKDRSLSFEMYRNTYVLKVCLTKHYCIHIGEKLFSCNICQKHYICHCENVIQVSYGDSYCKGRNFYDL